MEAVLEAENVTLVFMDRLGRFIFQNAHKKIFKGVTFLAFLDLRSQKGSR